MVCERSHFAVPDSGHFAGRNILYRASCSRRTVRGGAARDVGAPPRVCATAGVLYESYINLAPPFRLYAATVGRGSTRSAGWKPQLPVSCPSTVARRQPLVPIRGPVATGATPPPKSLIFECTPLAPAPAASAPPPVPPAPLNSVWSCLGGRRRLGKSIAKLAWVRLHRRPPGPTPGARRIGGAGHVQT